MPVGQISFDSTSNCVPSNFRRQDQHFATCLTIFGCRDVGTSKIFHYLLNVVCNARNLNVLSQQIENVRRTSVYYYIIVVRLQFLGLSDLRILVMFAALSVTKLLTRHLNSSLHFLMAATDT